MQKYYFNTITKFSIVLFLVGWVTSCDVIFEKDISEETLDLILPTDGQTYSTNQVHFKWVEIQGATDYRIEIVQPSFTSIQTFILDTLVQGNEYFYILNPGDYEFQIRAENSEYQSIFTGPNTITIDSVTDLSNQLVQLLSPANLYYTNSTTINCSWQSLFAADKYELQLRTGLDFNTSSTISHVKTDIYSTSYTIPSTNLTEGEYSWGVKAVNQNSTTDFSSYSFIIDTTRPNNVSLISPADNFSSSTQTVVFKWDSGVDPGSVNTPVTTVFELATDVNFSTISVVQNNITVDSLEYTFSTAGDYWWRVYAEDSAGNISLNYSVEQKVTVP